MGQLNEARVGIPLSVIQPNLESREKGIPHNCGIAGVYSPKGDVAYLIEHVLASLNHRGQEGAGVVIVGDKEDFLHKGKGLVKQVITSDVLAQMRAVHGQIAIGQDRYSTAGELDAWQPFYDKDQRFGLVHNGNFTNVDTMLQLIPENKREERVSDSWVAHQAILASKTTENSWEDAIKAAVGTFEGAYSLIMQSDKKLFALRDAKGMRPLCIGQLSDGSYIVASEPNSFPALGAKFIRDVAPGEAISIDETGIHSFWTDPRALPDTSIPEQQGERAFCAFEFLYMAKPDSFLEGKSVSQIRQRLGAALAKRDKEAGMDMSNAVVVGVQDSGTVYAQAYANEVQRPLVPGLVKNVYETNGLRVFQMNGDRSHATRLKHAVNPFEIEGKDVFLVDDSLVRGTTMKELIQALRDAATTYGLQGPRSIHVRIAAPRIMNPCFWGVDFSTRAELANDGDAIDPVEAIRRMIGADSLEFTTPHDVVGAIYPDRVIDPNLSEEEVWSAHGLCGHCFGGRRPTEITEDGLMRKKPRLRGN